MTASAPTSCIEAIFSGRPGLIVHVGAGSGSLGARVLAARRAVLVEPCPQRASELRSRFQASQTVRVVEAAAAAVDGVPANQIVTQDDFEGEGDNLLLIDAADDGPGVLDALEAAGWLDRFDHVICQVSETGAHALVPSRDAVETWVKARGRFMLALAGQGGELWRAWISPARGPVAGSATGPVTGRARQLETALETYRAASREAEARWLEQRGALMQELHASKARCAQLEAAAVPPEAAPEAGARERTLRDDLMRELDAARARARELAASLHEAEAARARAQADLQAARGRADGPDRDQAARHERDWVRLQEAAREAAERERELTRQLTAAREDVRLAITGQRLTQASLSELQARYGALLDERNALDGLLRQLTDRLSSAVNARLEGSVPGVRQDWGE
ncbi:MAG: hypothetical protein GC187_03185 [Alphaproteobacteria bacterium]|nr:hypothetical protein [Alphaproteobacteria bacterium]